VGGTAGAAAGRRVPGAAPAQVARGSLLTPPRRGPARVGPRPPHLPHTSSRPAACTASCPRAGRPCSSWRRTTS